ncbi:MAG: tetratricopeptide repeat protein [Acidobacteria bacterium]|nr:tetratricopeptide repeat protein [Acidobacteriota bacterium]
MSAWTKLCLALALLLSAGGCNRGEEGSVKLPPPPEFDLSSLGENPRLLVEEALARLEQNPNDAGLNGQLGMLFHAYGRYADAAAMYGRARQLAPKAGRWSYYQGVTLAELKQVDGAAEAFKENRERWPDHAPTLLRLARLYFEAGELAKSDALRKQGRATLDQLIEQHPDFAPGLIELARRQSGAGDDQAAIESLHKAIDLNYPGKEAHQALAEILDRRGEKEEAERYRVLAAKRPAVQDLGDRWMAEIRGLAVTDLGFAERGEQLVKANRLGPAATEFERAIEAGGDEDARVNLIAVYGMQGLVDKAEQQYRSALREGVETGRLHLNMATVLLGQGRHKEAEELYLKAMTIDPFLLKAYLGMSRSCFLQKRLADAQRWSELAVKREPESTPARFELARVLRAQGKPSAALPHIQVAIRYSEGKDQLQAYRLLAKLQLDTHDPEAAAATLRTALETARSTGDNVEAILIQTQIDDIGKPAAAEAP